MNWRKLSVGILGLALIAALFIAYLPAVQAQTYPRNETLIIGGAYWEPPRKWNPFNYGASVSGVVGLVYEPLYIWIPIKSEAERLQGWLAAGLPNWISDTEVEIKIRPQAKWWDGRDVTCDDVAFTYKYVPSKVPGATWAGMANYIADITCPDPKTVRIKFTEPNYADFYYQLYEAPILPKHVLQPYVDQYGNELVDVGTWLAVADNRDPRNIIASGMYKVVEIGDDYFMLQRVDNWWGKDVFGLPAPKYIKGVVVFSNQVAANMLGAGQLDWSCFYIPGGADMVRRGLAVAYFKEAPLYLSANVAFLFVNQQKKPFNDPTFRKALYYAIDVNKIISAAFEGLVVPSNPVGLLPYWEEYLAADVIQAAGFDPYRPNYNPDKAKELLGKAGYTDKDGDGWRDMPDGTPIRIRIIVPYGWTDWMLSIINIADDLRKVGIYAEASFPDFGVYIEMVDKATYDAAINNFGSFASVSPYTLYYWAYCASPGIWTGNHGRYNNPEFCNLVDQLGRTHPANKDQIKSILRQIQEILVNDMPALPLWYNGYWFLASTQYWVGWPSEDNPYGVPIIWNGQWQHGGMLVLLNLRPAAAPTTPTTPPPAPTVTITTTVTTTVERTVATTVTTTVTVPTTVTTTVPVGTATVTTVTTTVERTVATTVTSSVLTTVTTTTTLTVPTTVTVTETVTDWTITIVLAVVLLVVGFVAGWFLRKIK